MDSTPPEEALTPAQAEAAVKKASNKVWFATQEYRRTGYELVDAKNLYLIARTRAHFDDDCPKVTRGETTVGDRDEWINRAIHGESMALYAAEINRENAIESLRSARNEQAGAMAVNASVRESYRFNLASDS